MNEASTSNNVLRRSRQERMIAGVAGGLAQHFNVDPVLVRLGFVVLTLWNGLGLLLYIVLAIVTPNRSADEAEPTVTASKLSLSGDRGRDLVAYALVGLGAVILAGNMGLNHIINWNYIWPLVLIVIGAILLIRRDAD